MQPLTAPPRDGLTQDRVRQLLVGAGSVTYDRGLEVLDASLNVLDDVSGSFQGGTVTRTMDATVHGSCQLTTAADFPFAYGSQLLRPYMSISDDLGAARFNAGVYRIALPSIDHSTDLPTNTLTGSDRISLLNRQVGDAYLVTAGTRYLAAALQVFVDAGLDPGTVLVDGSAADKTLPADKPYPLLADSSSTLRTPVDVSSDSSSDATTWLAIVNDLLAAVGYGGVWADENGFFRLGPYAPPSSRSVEFSFDFDDELLTSITPDRQVQFAQSDPVNVWIFQQSNLVDSDGNSIEPVEGAGQYTVENTGTGFTSIIGQGGMRWPTVVLLDAADQDSLVAQGDAIVDDALAYSVTFSVTTAPFPLAWHHDIYEYADVAVNGGPGRKVQNMGWTLDLGDSTAPPADMTHTWHAS